MIKQAVILAGGKGTRLDKLTGQTPKPLIPIGGKTIMEHQLELLKENGIEKVLLTVGHLKEKIKELIGDGSQYGLEVSYFVEDHPLGSAGAFPLLKDRLHEHFFVLYGDVMMAVDLNRIACFHQHKGASATLVVHPNDHPHDSDLVECDSNSLIKAFHPKPHEKNKFYKNLVNAGLYLFNKKLVDFIPLRKSPDFGKNIFPSLAATQKLYAYNTSEYLKDMGTPERLQKVTEDYLSGRIARRKLTNKQKVIFLDRDGVLNEDRHLIRKTEDFVLYNFTSKAIKKINNSDFLVIVVTNQSVAARNLCTIEQLEEIHKKLDTELGKDGAKLDALYYCPYHPDKGYPEENPKYKREHPWRKPNPGMLLEASNRFNIDLEKSFMIGDRESDIQAGKNAGTQTMGVMTGHGLKNSTTEPHYTFENVLEAVDFILKEPYQNFAHSLKEEIEKSSKSPYIVIIGGNAGSGKSNCSHYLKNYLEKHQLTSIIISLDHWCLPAKDRNSAKDVFERYQLVKIEEDLNRLLNNKEIQLSGYFKHPDRKTKNINYSLTEKKVIIIEGIVALNLKFAVRQADKCVFMDIDKKTYSKRFKSLYTRKGLGIKEIEALLEKRMQDEFELIRKAGDLAQCIIL
ncbi:MAG: HAD-IIIA family hydrolase [Ekhidna sp.]|nr:HAD-IIIA family hydrolase [Ekhidna sp.]